MSSAITVLLWATVVGSGLIAGVYFAFSVFVMQAFRELDDVHAVAAMNSINKVILRSLFMPLFFGSTLCSMLLIVLALGCWGELNTGLMLIAGAVFFIGMFVCTVIVNVPLNNILAKVTYTNVQQTWLRYYKIWTRWNHLRTLSSIVTCLLSLWILVDR